MNKWLRISLVVLGCISTAALLIFVGIQSRATTIHLEEIDISIHSDGESAFLTEIELKERLLREELIYEGQKVENLKIDSIENYISSMNEVKEVKAFTGIDGELHIQVELRQPIARIFNKFGESFYLDSEGYTMQPSELHTARVVVVNGNIPDRINSENVAALINNDSLKSIRKLDDIYRITTYVCKDTLLRAQIAQVFLNQEGDFVLTPQVGGQTIIFGTAHSDEEVENKFKKLKTFYQEAIPYEGWNTYSEISLKYENQIVCKKKS
ncbi:MAG: hypothetical protein N4A41_04730 [Crocinitomicaceae bacterium]|jgi:cell division protein FtsQ|nr:hypothetical protein [Crocinitomicaceae bacterium]